jgi:hypothetical protein
VGGGKGNGTIFRINPDGTSFKTIYAFSSPSVVGYTNSDGIKPDAILTISGSSIYGTTKECGLYGYGTLFKVGIDGAGFTTLHYFKEVLRAPDGRLPKAVTLVNDVLYGITSWGGVFDNGLIYSVKLDGDIFEAQYCFPTAVDVGNSSYPQPFFKNINSVGALPFSGVIYSSNVLYGVTATGGTNGYGVVYSLSLEPLPPPEITGSFTNGWVGLIKLTWPVNIPGFPPVKLQNSANPSFQTYSYTPSPIDCVTNGQTVSGVLPIPLFPQRFFRLVYQW